MNRSPFGEGFVRLLVLVVSAASLAGCAGRDPEQISTVQPYDNQTSCTQIKAEIEANNGWVKAPRTSRD